MKPMRKTRAAACGSDLAWMAGAWLGLSAVLWGLFGLLHLWFIRCAAAPVDWGAVLRMKG